MPNNVPAAVALGMLLSGLEKGSTDKSILLNPPKMFYFSFEKWTPASQSPSMQHIPGIASELVGYLH